MRGMGGGPASKEDIAYAIATASGSVDSEEREKVIHSLDSELVIHCADTCIIQRAPNALAVEK